MMSAYTQDEIVAKLHRALAGADDLVAVYLFGSFAEGTAHAFSDVDIAVLFTETTPEDVRFRRTLEMGAAAEDALATAVDIVSLNDAPIALRFQALRHGRLIIENDRDERSLFVMRTLGRYYDEKRYLDYHNAQFLKRLQEEGLGRGYHGDRNALSEARRLSAKLKANAKRTTG